MIIDCILSRYEKSRENGSYYSESFRNRVADYIYEDISDADEIVDAMDNGNEQEVKAALITYLIDKGYNPRIIDYVLSVDWLKDIPNEQPSVIDLGAKPIGKERAEELRNIYKNTDSEYAKQRAWQNLETEGVSGYTIDNVCGMVGDFWKSNAVSYTDTAPILVNEDIETTLNEIEQANKEKNEEIER